MSGLGLCVGWLLNESQEQMKQMCKRMMMGFLSRSYLVSLFSLREKKHDFVLQQPAQNTIWFLQQYSESVCKLTTVQHFHLKPEQRSTKLLPTNPDDHSRDKMGHVCLLITKLGFSYHFIPWPCQYLLRAPSAPSTA